MPTRFLLISYTFLYLCCPVKTELCSEITCPVEGMTVGPRASLQGAVGKHL